VRFFATQGRLGSWAKGEHRDAEDVASEWLDERLTKEERRKAVALQQTEPEGLDFKLNNSRPNAQNVFTPDFRFESEQLGLWCPWKP
jgi:hypothetical protein